MRLQRSVPVRVVHSLRPFALSALVLVACSSKDDKKVMPEPPKAVPEPAGLMGEIYIPKPGQLWTRARNLVGTPGALLPQVFGQGAGMLLGLPVAVGDQFDNEIPALGAAVAEGETQYFAVGFHVKDGPRFVTMATQGPNQKFSSRLDAASGVTILEPNAAAASTDATKSPVMGVAGNYLLVSYSADGLMKVGPYISRTMPTKPVPAANDDAVVVARQQALAGPVKARMSSWWTHTKKELQDADAQARQAHGGAQPTFGDPVGAIAKMDTTFQSLFAIVGDLQEAKLNLVLDDFGLHLKATLTPKASGGPAKQEFDAMVVGDPKPLLQLPEDSGIALMLRDSQEMRTRSVQEQLEAFDKILAGKLGPDDKKKLQEVFEGWSKGRGDLVQLGVGLTNPTMSFYLRSQVANQEVLDKSIRQLLELPKVPALSEPIQHWLGEMKIETPTAGKEVSIAKIERKLPVRDLSDQRPAGPPDPRSSKADVKGPPPKIEPGKPGPTGKPGDKDKLKPGIEKQELAWTYGGSMLTAALAADGKVALDAMNSAEKTIGSDADVKRAVEALGTDASFVLVLMPMRVVSGLLPTGRSRGRDRGQLPSAPVALAMGRANEGAYFRLDAHTLAVREFANMQMRR